MILSGRMDIEGAASVDLQLSIIAGCRKAVLMDLRQVSYLGSMGLSCLLIPARTIRAKGGKVVFFGPNERVGEVLKISAIDTVIPVHREFESALAALY